MHVRKYEHYFECSPFTNGPITVLHVSAHQFKTAPSEELNKAEKF